MLFKDVVGQHELKEKINRLVKNNHLPHAIMLLGKEGNGGLPLALALAQFIQCENKQEEDSCGECSACVKMAKLQHPDVHFSFPTIRKDSSSPPVSNDFILEFRQFATQTPYGNEQAWLNSLGAEKQGNITAYECRDIIRKLNFRSFESRYKILIMWGPENLGNEGNILLKLIEEPTADTILIFVAIQLDKVLATIQSRTQLFPLKPLTLSDIQQALMQLNVPEQHALHIAKLSEGNYYEALKLIDEKEDVVIQQVKQWLNAMYTNKGLDLMEWVFGIADLSKEPQKRFLLFTIQLFEHVLRYQYLGNQGVTLSDVEVKIIENLIQKGMTPQRVQRITEILNNSVYELERNANSKILFHSLSLRVQQIVLAKKGNLETAG